MNSNGWPLPSMAKAWQRPFSLQSYLSDVYLFEMLLPLNFAAVFVTPSSHAAELAHGFLTCNGGTLSLSVNFQRTYLQTCADGCLHLLGLPASPGVAVLSGFHYSQSAWVKAGQFTPLHPVLSASSARPKGVFLMLVLPEHNVCFPYVSFLMSSLHIYTCPGAVFVLR